jgi:hypothetical protein
MSKRKRWIIVFVLVLGVITFWILGDFGTPRTDEERYQRFVRTMRRAGWLRSTSGKLPGVLATPLDRIAGRAWDGVHAQEEALLASGYLTNISIMLPRASTRFSDTNAMPSMTEISTQIHTAVPDNSFVPFSLSRDFQRSNVAVEVMCRSSDVPLLRKALESY